MGRREGIDRQKLMYGHELEVREREPCMEVR